MRQITVEYVLRLLGCNRTAPSGNYWIMTPCPLASVRHDKGEDRHPSLGVSIKPGPSYIKCHSCGISGTLRRLVIECRREGLVSSDDADLALAKCKYAEKREPAWRDEGAELDEQPVLNPKALDFLSRYHRYYRSRGYSKREIIEWRLGFTKQRLLLPCVLPAGEIPYLQVRAVSEKKFWFEPSGIRRAHAVGSHLLTGTEQGLVVVEGIFDALRVRRAIRRLKAIGELGVVALFGSKPSADVLDHVFTLVKNELIVLADNDVAGELLAEQLEEEGSKRVRKISVVTLPAGIGDPDKCHSKRIAQLLQDREDVMLRHVRALLT